MLMRSCNKTYTITEYGGFTRGIPACGYQELPEKTFDALEAFILANSAAGDEPEALELLSLSVRRGVGKIITVRNYVGLITMTDGTVIEILPKIAGEGITVGETKRIFMGMLKTLKDMTFRDFNVSNLDTDRLGLLEIFIKMFLDEVTILTKQGLKAAYMPSEANERFYKGKLLASQNIKYNLVSREHFFVRYDDFSVNRPENRLIKSTLRFLLNTTDDGGNRRNALRLLSYFNAVEYSANHDADFSRCAIDRSMNHYGKALLWCRVFLKGNSFTTFAGSNVAFALLFPMEKVFESYIAAKFRRHIGSSANLRTQDKRYSLFDRPTKAFGLCPDIVIEIDGEITVMDTKWKLLSGNARNYGVSQSDMYQMYAYSKKYNAQKTILLYPMPENPPGTEIAYHSDDGVTVALSFIDLLHLDASVQALMQEETSLKQS